MIVSIAYSANNVRTSCGIYSLMYHIHKTSSVSATAPVGYPLRAVGAFGMALGTLVLGARLVPVTGQS